MSCGETGISSYPYAGVEKYLAYAPITGTSWSLGVTVPANEAKAQLNAFAWISLITIITVLILAIIVILWSAARITKPPLILEETASRIAGGNLSITSINVRSQDELGRLARAFETMIGNLRALVKKLIHPQKWWPHRLRN